MNKSAIKNFAANARRKLIEDICQMSYNIGKNDKILWEDSVSQKRKIKCLLI